MRLLFQLCFALSFLLSFTWCGSEQKLKNENSDDGGEDKGLLLYRQLFQARRQDHMEAINNILALQDYEKQYKLVSLVYEKLFEVLTEAKAALQQTNYIPGEKFPTEENTRDALSSVLENTAFFGEIQLRLPDISHDIYEKRKEWKDILAWAVLFAQQTRVFEGVHATFLHLVAQELNLVERDPDYQNPYKMENKLTFQGSEPVKPKKKEKKTKKRGPRLSRSRSEL